MVFGAWMQCEDRNMRKAKLGARVFSLLVLLLLLSLNACSRYPSTYSAEAIEAWVIDGKTKKPIEGVVVTANWELEVGTLGGNIPAGQLMVMESMTDKSGRFYFPSWGPKRRPRGTFNLFASRPHLVYSDPQLLLFKRGYEYLRLRNKIISDYNTGGLRKSDWSGRTIELKPFAGTIKAYENQFEWFNRYLERVAADVPEECGWKKIPNTIRAMNRERMHLIAQGVDPNTLSSIDQRLLLNDEYFAKKGGCGSPRALLEDLQK